MKNNKNNYEKYICDECGSNMEKADEEVLVCPSCKHSVDIEDYGHEHDYDDYYSSIKEEDDEPECCKSCGGPYPSCMTSCKFFDD